MAAAALEIEPTLSEAVVDFVVSIDHYLGIIKPFKGNFHVNRGKIYLKNDTLARLVMGLKIGDYDQDALEILHSSSGKRWNRPCDLRTELDLITFEIF